jgi:hypothetical protein
VDAADLARARADAREAAVLRKPLPAVLAVTTDRGLLQIVPAPLGTRGYDDPRRRATREPLGRGLRPSVAAPEDLARLLRPSTGNGTRPPCTASVA